MSYLTFISFSVASKLRNTEYKIFFKEGKAFLKAKLSIDYGILKKTLKIRKN